MKNHRTTRLALAAIMAVACAQLRCGDTGPACEEAMACCAELAPALAQDCEAAVDEARGEASAEEVCEDTVAAWRSAGVCGGEPGPENARSCGLLRTCCEQLGPSAGACLATLNSLEEGPRPESDCASAMAGFAEAGSCSVAGAPGPESSDAVCSDGFDNDGDGFVDCRDDDCADHCAEVCDDGVDNDGDRAVDCLDADCAGLSVCVEGPETGWERCHDGIDNDGDGFIDCNGGYLGGSQVSEDYDCTNTPGSC